MDFEIYPYQPAVPTDQYCVRTFVIGNANYLFKSKINANLSTPSFSNLDWEVIGIQPASPLTEITGNLYLNGHLSEDGTKILNNYCRFTGVPFNASIVVNKPNGSPYTTSDVDDAIIFNNRTELGGGFSKRDYEGLANVLWFGAKSDGSQNASPAIQMCLDNYGQCYIPGGKYLIENTISNYRTMSLTDYYSPLSGTVVNGIILKGESKSTVTLIHSVAGGGPAIDLDGNYFHTGTLTDPACQVGNNLSGFTIEGGTENVGIRINANWEAEYYNIRSKGVETLFELAGAAIADSATSNMLKFRKIICSNGVFGIKGEQARMGTIDVDACEFRNLSTNAIQLTCAVFSIKSSNIVRCGNNTNAKSGGIRINTGTTPSQNRSISITSNVFENNKWSDILLENASGVEIDANAFHPYFTIPTGVGNEMVCVRIAGEATFGVEGVSLGGNRVQSMSNPVSGPEIVRFIKASGVCRNIKVNGLSAPIDSHLQYLFDISTSVQDFYTDSFGAGAGWKIPQGTAVPAFTGDASLVMSIDPLICTYIQLDYDQSSGLNSSSTRVGSRFNNQFAYLVPWSGIYNISTECNLSGLDPMHTNIRIVLIAGTTRKRIRDITNNLPLLTSKGIATTQLFLPKGASVYLYIQVIGGPKSVTVSEVSQHIPLSLSITQIM